jgi:hypothetical protein
MNVEIHSEYLPFAVLFIRHLQSHLCASLFLSGGGEYLRCRYFYTIQQKVLGVTGKVPPSHRTSFRASKKEI